ncbi:MAG: molybdopterin-dependent oxidoreductase [Anaerolineae bacterium]|nr:molybdopterin-dependent oxidoreductase [Anaerolineae bacterium]
MDRIEHRRLSVWAGLLVGALITAPLLALFALGAALLRFPLIPTDLVDWMARTLPGNVITAGIDFMKSLIVGFQLGRTDVVAKLIEQAFGYAMLFGLGVITTAAVYRLLNGSLDRQRINLYTLGSGALLGVIAVLIHLSLPFPSTVDPLLRAIWIIALFLGWGAAMGWIYYDLTRLPVVKSETASAQQLDRREFLVRIGGATATLTVLGGGLSLLMTPREESVDSDTISAPPPTPEPIVSIDNPGDPTLEAAPGTRPEYTPLDQHYRIDISTFPPNIDGTTWTLPITGLVGNALNLTLKEIRDNYPARDLIITMSCISNEIGGDLISTTRWTGTPLKGILEQLAIQPEGRFLKITAADGFDEYLDLAIPMNDESVILCYDWDGQPLKQKHGFPLRIHIPNLYGMKQPKWITAMEVVDEWREGYWVRRGWSRDAVVRTTSVVDTVATNGVYERDGQTFVPVGGIAYAAVRGIVRVEVSVNNEPWQEAQLRAPLSDRSWVIWRYDWPFSAGRHTFRVRAVDGTNDPQIESREGVRPDGATGIHERAANLEA